MLKKRYHALKTNTNDVCNELFDKKTLWVSALFYFSALVNPRDFPVHNIPLIYPAFILFVILIGPNKIIEGVRRTKLLLILLIIYWLYITVFLVIFKGNLLIRWAYLVEPIMIVIASAMTTTRPGGSKASLWAFFSVISFSAACGLWIYFIGEPIASFRHMLQQYISGNPFQGTIWEPDFASMDTNNAGLSLYVFHFSYQLAAAATINALMIFNLGRSRSIKFLSLCAILIMLCLAIITNAERAIILSVASSLFLFLLVSKNKFTHSIKKIFLIIVILSIMTNLLISLNMGAKDNLLNRLNKSSEEQGVLTRAIVMPLSASMTIIGQPFGTGGGSSDYYETAAVQHGWLSPSRSVMPSHNHFANIIMYAGLTGLLIVGILFCGIIRKINFIRLNLYGNIELMLSVLSVTIIVHSFTHNAGFFNLEPTSEVILGLLWGVTAKTRRHNNIRHIYSQR